MHGLDTFENALDEKFCRFLAEQTQTLLRNGDRQWRSNLSWQDGVVRSSHLVLIRECPEAERQLILAQLIKKEIVSTLDYVVMIYAWTKYSYIPWHNDGHKESAITIFLNNKWEEDWGGLFLYKNENEQILGITPKFNMAIRNKGHVPHAVTMITPDAETLRLTLQIFSKSSRSA